MEKEIRLLLLLQTAYGLTVVSFCFAQRMHSRLLLCKALHGQTYF